QQGCQFAGERSGNRIRMPVLWVKINACLCSIRDHEPQLRVVGKCQKAFILQIRVDRGTDTADQPHFIYYLSVLEPSGDHMIEASLGIKRRCWRLSVRLDNLDVSVEACFLVEDIHCPVYKSPKEIAGAELKDFNGSVRCSICVLSI